MGFYFWGLLIFHFSSFIVCLWAIQRLLRYLYYYSFDESIYTLLFGFIHLRYFVLAYFLMTAGATALGVLFAFSFL